MNKYRTENEIESSSKHFGGCRWKGVVCLAGILICLVIGSFCILTYGAATAEIGGSESEHMDTSGNPTSDVEDELTDTTEGCAEQEDGACPIQSMFDQCRKVFCRYQTYSIENHVKEKEAYQNYSNTKLSWWFRRDMNHGPSGCDDTIDISEYDAYYLDQTASKKNEKVVYLTFDCGYENGYTEQILDILKKEDVPACFFVTQTYIRDNVAIAKRMKEEGHQVGNHTIYHICMPDKSYEEIVQEVNGCAEYMKEATGYAMDPYLRPPCGEYSARTLAITQDLGFKTIFWSMAYMDFDVNNQPGVDFVIDHFNKYHHSGAIILMHNVSSSNAGALEKVIANLKAEGYRFASLNELQ